MFTLFTLFLAFLREYLKSALLLKMACWHFARMTWSQKFFAFGQGSILYIRGPGRRAAGGLIARLANCQ
nr:MAG TPA: hypothetical protein [Caudoviricetes sp.]